uniref:Uncharacterized protein n=1 Tax=Myotis myotis TaxID=51298 RepID=A0A7J7QXZ5_MYOMY|nr:hypothetical protein mMyoMyo1_011270 [Myotis myotis]
MSLRLSVSLSVCLSPFCSLPPTLFTASFSAAPSSVHSLSSHLSLCPLVTKMPTGWLPGVGSSIRQAVTWADTPSPPPNPHPPPSRCSLAQATFSRLWVSSHGLPHPCPAHSLLPPPCPPLDLPQPLGVGEGGPLFHSVPASPSLSPVSTPAPAYTGSLLSPLPPAALPAFPPPEAWPLLTPPLLPALLPLPCPPHSSLLCPLPFSLPHLLLALSSFSPHILSLLFPSCFLASSSCSAPALSLLQSHVSPTPLPLVTSLSCSPSRSFSPFLLPLILSSLSPSPPLWPKLSLLPVSSFSHFCLLSHPPSLPAPLSAPSSPLLSAPISSFSPRPVPCTFSPCLPPPFSLPSLFSPPSLFL